MDSHRTASKSVAAGSAHVLPNRSWPKHINYQSPPAEEAHKIDTKFNIFITIQWGPPKRKIIIHMG